MPDVKIKGYSGNELEYKDVPKVYLAAPESTPDNPVLVPFTYGEAVENVEISPDFSAGDMTIMVPDGYLARSAVVKRPTELIPENIAEGVNIAGIIGSLEATAGGAVFAMGKVIGTGSHLTIEHNLGVVPDVFFYYRVAAFTTTTSYLWFGRAFSASYIEKTGTTIPKQTNVSGKLNSSSVSGVYKTEVNNVNATLDENNQMSTIGSATNTTIQLGKIYQLEPEKTYYWFAIGGLT